jgi:hypothetical protein
MILYLPVVLLLKRRKRGYLLKIAFAKGIWNPPVVHGKVDKDLIIGICSFGVQ